MGEVERVVRAEVRFEVVDGILEGFFIDDVGGAQQGNLESHFGGDNILQSRWGRMAQVR